MPGRILGKITDQDLLVQVKCLLEKTNLLFVDIGEENVKVFGIIEEDTVIACGAIEPFDDFGLIRSVAVDPCYQNQGVGDQMVALVEGEAKAMGIHYLFLLTTTASAYFLKKGYDEISRTGVPAMVREAQQFKSLCPASAICMVKALLPHPIFPPLVTLLPKADIPIDGCEAYLAQEAHNQILYMYFLKDYELKEHRHSAQWSVVLEGTIELKINGYSRVYSRGERYYIPEGVTHSGKVAAGYADMTFFNQPDRYKMLLDG